MRISGISSSAARVLQPVSYQFFTDLLSNGVEFPSIRDKTVTELLTVSPTTKGAPLLEQREAQARDAARRLEVTFLAEMLKSAGFGEQANSFSGNPGEDHFASFHREAVAQKMVDRGGIGLAEHFFRSMMESYDDA